MGVEATGKARSYQEAVGDDGECGMEPRVPPFLALATTGSISYFIS